MSMSRAFRARSCPNSPASRSASRSSVKRRATRASRFVASALAVGVVGVPVLLPGAASAAPAPTSSEQARPAADFLNSLGVNIHMSYGKTRYADANATAAALRQVGITHVRENFRPTNTAEHQRLQVLQDAGIRFNMLIPRPDEADGKDPAQAVDAIASQFAGSTDSIEGPNEFNNSKMTDWPSALRSSQEKLRSSAGSNPATRGSRSMGRRSSASRCPRTPPRWAT